VLRKVRLEEAIGLPLGHDVTKVVPGEYKGPAFRRGHVIKSEDIEQLLSMGKEHVYVVEEEEDDVHEEEAALRIARAVSGSCLEPTPPKEGRVNIQSTINGLFKVEASLVRQVNSIQDVILATLHNNTICETGRVVAGTKIRPLYTSEANVRMVEDLCRQNGKVLTAVPLRTMRVGVVVTGSEVFKGRIKDAFVDTIRSKVEPLGSHVVMHKVVPDNEELIAQAIREMSEQGSEVVFVCGGLSVDPDDVTVEGIRQSGSEVVSCGAPVMPGAMFVYARLDSVPVMGIPGAAIYNKVTILDAILPRVLAGEEVTRDDIIELGYGGLCLNCSFCTYPVCPFCR
jgi:molybdenum cofactor synthesis domain-containing protein